MERAALKAATNVVRTDLHLKLLVALLLALKLLLVFRVLLLVRLLPVLAQVFHLLL